MTKTISYLQYEAAMVYWLKARNANFIAEHYIYLLERLLSVRPASVVFDSVNDVDGSLDDALVKEGIEVEERKFGE